MLRTLREQPVPFAMPVVFRSEAEGAAQDHAGRHFAGGPVAFEPPVPL